MATTVLGVLSGLLGILQFGISNFPDAPPEGSAYKFAVGLDGTYGLTNAGGDLPDVRVWDHNAKFLGISLGMKKVAHGDFGVVSVNHDYAPTYTLFSANGDAICIAWVTAQYSKNAGGNSYLVTGDMGAYCDSEWYYSGMHHAADPQEEPKCFWIDKNGDVATTGFQIHWPSFTPDAGNPSLPNTERDPRRLCDGVKIGFRTEPDPSTINYRRLPILSRIMRRSPADVAGNMGRRRGRRNKAMESQLVVGDNDGLSARFLCESSTSLGPDLLNIKEGLFCDMGEKKLYPVCGGDSQAACFDIDSKAIKGTSDENVAGFSAGFDASSRASPQFFEKFYNTTLDWRHNKDARI